MSRAPSRAWSLHLLPLPVGELLRLEQHRVRDGELADVVEQRRLAEHVELRPERPQLAADRDREPLHLAGVPGRTSRSSIDRGQRLDHRGRVLAQRVVRLLEHGRARRIVSTSPCSSAAMRCARPPRGPASCAREQQRHGDQTASVREPGRAVRDARLRRRAGPQLRPGAAVQPRRGADRRPDARASRRSRRAPAARPAAMTTK